MITHMVVFKVRPDVSEKQVRETMQSLGALRGKIPGLQTFSGGPYSSPEGLNKSYTHGFCMTFRDAAARDGYLTHAEHELVKQRVLAILDGGIESVVAFDYES